MNKCAIISAFYYIADAGFDYKNIIEFCKKVNATSTDVAFCKREILEERLDKINTRLIDRQSLSLEAAIKIAEDENFFDSINRSELSIIAGSYSSSVYPSAIFNLSAKEKGPNFVNATEFTNTVGNAAVSRACIWNQFRGCAYALSEGINSGMNSIVDAYKNVQYENAEDVLVCATEEVGAAAVLLQKEAPGKLKNKPIAYIKNVDSKYIGSIKEFDSYIKNIEEKFNISLRQLDVYLSGDAKNINDIFKIIKEKGAFTHDIIKKNMWSLNPMIDLGRSLSRYSKGSVHDSLILSVDSQGFAACVLISKGG